MQSPLVASAVTNVPPRIPCFSVVVLSKCRTCGKTEQIALNLQEGTTISEPVMRTCKDCTVKYDKLGRPIRQRKVKSLSLDYREAENLPEGMTGTDENPGTPEPEDAETLALEARWQRNLVAFAQEDVLDLIKDQREREVVRLRLVEGKSISQTRLELNAEGIKISRAHVANVEKAAVAKLRKLLKPVGLERFMGEGVPVCSSYEAARQFLDGDAAQESLGGTDGNDDWQTV